MKPGTFPDGICGIGNEIGGLGTNSARLEGVSSGAAETGRGRADVGAVKALDAEGVRPRLLDLCIPAWESLALGAKRLFSLGKDRPEYGGGG